ncbi:hypothetical protein MTO96_023721 [Rhipicephalus appendiculatus]
MGFKIEDVLGDFKFAEVHVDMNLNLTSFSLDALIKSKDLLRKLSAYGNALQTFAFYELQDFPRLKSLNLARNQISTIPPNAFSHPNLRSLLLAKNSITYIGQLAFRNLPKLQRLELSSNNIKTLGPYSIALSTSLPRLKLKLLHDMLEKARAVFILACLSRCLVSECSRTASQDPASGRCVPRPESYSVENRATCTFTRVVDIDSRRIPSEIASVKCKCPGSICSDRGDFRCLEVKQTVKVSYPRNGACGSRSAVLVNKTVEVTTACVCALSRTLSAAEDGLARTSFRGSNTTNFK